MGKNYLFVLAILFVMCALPACAPASSIAATTTDTPTAPTTPVIAVQIPLINTLYLGVVEGQDAIFVTDSEVQQNSGDPYSGKLTTADAYYRQPFSFVDLENPRELFSVPGQTVTIVNFVFDREKAGLYVAVAAFDEAWPGGSAIATVYEVLPEAPGFRALWFNYIRGDSNRYSGYEGVAHVDQVQGNYMVISLMPCYGCEPHLPWLVLVNNTTSGAEKVLGQVGNVAIDIERRIVTYQNLAPVQTPCEPSPGCDNGYRTDYAPAGQVLEEALP